MVKFFPLSVFSIALVGVLSLSMAPANAQAAASGSGYQIPGNPMDRGSWMGLLSAAHDKFVQAGERKGRNIQIINLTSAPDVGWVRRVFDQNADGSSVSTQVNALSPQGTEGELAFEQRCVGFGSCLNRVIGTDQWITAPRSASPVDLSLSALIPQLWPVESGLEFYEPVPGSFAYVTRGTGIADSALVDIRYSGDVLEFRIWEGNYSQIGRVDTNARRASVVDPVDSNGFMTAPITRAEAENLTPTVVRRHIEEDTSDNLPVDNLMSFVARVAAVPARLPQSRLNIGRFPNITSEWKSFTPKVCRMTTQGTLIARKPGNCSLGVSFSSESSPEFRMGKQIRVLP